MKQSGTTIVFVLVCVGVLVAAFVIGIGIRKARFGGAENGSATVIAPEKSPSEIERERVQASRMPGSGGTDGGGERSPEERTALVEQREGMRERYENMTDEEKE